MTCIASPIMRPVLFIALILGLLPHPALCQVVAAHGPVVNAAVGYSYLDLAQASNSRVGLNGADANLSLDFRSRVGLRLDIGYARGSNVLGSGRHADVLSYLAGPVAYPIHYRQWTTYAEALAGAARVTGPIPSANGFLGAYVNKLAWVIGGGLEYDLSSSWAFRAGAEYMHTTYYLAPTRIGGQNNMRAVAEIVHRFGGRRR
jgi:opacity protein-like surface antigen